MPPSPPPAPVLRSVSVLTDLNSDQESQGRRKFSLGSILNGRGGNRTVGVNTRHMELSVGGTHVEAVVGDDSALVPETQRHSLGVERGSQTRAVADTGGDIPETLTERRPMTHDAASTTDLSLDDLRHMCDLRDQLDELRELQRTMRASSSETRDTFTQIKEYELGVNYVRGAFAFVKSINCGAQTDPIPSPAPLRSSMTQTDPELKPERPATRAFAAQVHPALASAGVQCRTETDSRGVEARPNQRDVSVTAEHRRHSRSVGVGTDAVKTSPVTQAGVRSPKAYRRDAGTTTVTPLMTSRAVSTDRPKELLKKVGNLGRGVM